ncbi:hypothetical protein EST38_g12477 [Candolleomyces aberdarensis]|uniref:Cytochrome P450 n=1 Tax=Candolleomyces aberdarensis TaxID=2316362 RepID=A0A4V1Q202_9AGAR|nr:hypothetical protein EST38_g12477 [Candolleomyces aberdarensis]
MWLYVDIALGLAVISLLYGLSKRRKKLNLPLPPGPKGAPLVGNLLQMPTEFEWIKFHEWCKEYNTDVLYLNIAGTEMIILDSSKAATDLLETRSSLYSGRPRLPMLNELVGGSWHVAVMPYGATWRKHRRFLHHSFHSAATKEYRPHMTKSARNLLKRFLDDPNPFNIMPHLRHMAGETILSIIYGIHIKDTNDPYLKTSEAGLHAITAAGVPGAFLVDAIPLLKCVPAWFPGASFQRKAREWSKAIRDMVEVPYAETKKNIESGKINVSMVLKGLQKMEEGKEDEAFTRRSFRTPRLVFLQTVSAIASCILGFLEHPEVLKKAQTQVDSVVEPGCLPGFEHESSLPYITAITSEVLRWRDVVPIETEDEYKGYRLPAGATIVPNAWAMLHDENVYSDPFTFNPDRFINPQTGQVDYTHARDPSHACWGFGRRVCPGRYMAFSATWLGIASLVAVFDIEKAKEKVTVVGEDGIEIEEERTVELTRAYNSSLVIAPKPFECVIKPRSKEKADLIRESLIQDYD